MIVMITIVLISIIVIIIIIKEVQRMNERQCENRRERERGGGKLGGWERKVEEWGGKWREVGRGGE